MSSGLYNEGLFREGLLRTTNLVRPGLITQFDTLEEALTRFAVNGVEAALALDFIASEYRTANTATTFADAFTGTSPKLTYSTSAGSNSTMVNSSGNIVWAPHNLVTHSQDFSQWGAGSAGTGTPPVITPDAGTAPDGSLGAYRVQMDLGGGTTSGDFSQLGTLPAYGGAGVDYTLSVWMKSYDGNSYDVMLDFNASAVQIETITNQWRLVSTTVLSLDTVGRPVNVARLRGGTGTSNTADILIWGAHVYRSDLGGMAQVPQSATGLEYYVPTNGSAEYLPRVGHHVYNGSTWVNEGLLIESEARTNLVANSQLGGAVVGVVGSGGALPTGWASVAFNTVEVMEIDTFQGVPRIRIKATCDNSGSGGPFYPRIEIGSYSPSASTTYNYSAWVMDGPDRSSIEADLLVPDGVGNFLNVDCSGATEMTQFSGSATTAAGATGTHTIRVAHTVLAGDVGVSDFYISMPQFEVGEAIPNTNPVQYKDAPTPSSYMPTSGNQFTRTAQSLEVPPAEFGWPEPEYIGPELADGSQLDKRSGTDGTVSRAGGIISFTPAASGLSSAISEEITGLTVGKVYEFRGRARSSTSDSGTLQLRSGSGGGGSTLASSSTGFTTSFADCSIIYKATGTSVHLSYLPAAGQGIEIVEASHSFREINPLSVSIQMDGRITYADNNVGFAGASAASEVVPYDWRLSGTDYIMTGLETDISPHRLWFVSEQNNVPDLVYSEALNSPGVLVPFNLASRHGSTFINGAVDGVALTADTTPTALPDLSGTDLQIAYDFMGTIGTFRQFAGDIGDTGLVTATNPSTEPTLSLTFDGTDGSFYNLSWSE